MTFERLYQYKTIEKQIELLKSKSPPEVLRGVDTTKVNVASGSTSNPTADIAEQRLFIEQELTRLENEKQEIESFIADINDEFIRAIAFNKFVLGMTYQQIASQFFTNRNRVAGLLKEYIKDCA